MPNLSVLDGGVNGLIRSIKKHNYKIETNFSTLNKNKDYGYINNSAYNAELPTASTALNTLENGQVIDDKSECRHS